MQETEQRVWLADSQKKKKSQKKFGWQRRRRATPSRQRARSDTAEMDAQASMQLLASPD
jgi:hypothetical protein